MSGSTVSSNLMEVNAFVVAPTTSNGCLLATKVVTPLSGSAIDLKQEHDQVDETLTTDVGSTCSSDSESCSSVADNGDTCRGPLRYRRHASQRSTGGCSGTRLETIPGTPVASGPTEAYLKAVQSTPTPTKQHDAIPSPIFGEVDSDTCAHITLSDVPAMPPPRSPKRRTRPSALTITPSEPVVNAVALGLFGTVPALPLPGSPKKRAGAPTSNDSHATSVRCGAFGTVPTSQGPRSPKKRSKATEVESTTNDRAHGALQAPKRQAQDATMTKAKRNGMPLKVKLPDHLGPAGIQGLDNMTPLKKRPVFADIAGPEPANALLRLEPNMPVKKRVPNFLLEETFRGVQAPPGLEPVAVQPPPGLGPMVN